MSQDPIPPRNRTTRSRLYLPAARSALRAIDAKAQPDLKRAVPAGVIAIVAFSVGDRLGGIERARPAIFHLFGKTWHASTLQATILVLALALVFLSAGIIATRTIGREIGRVSELRGGIATGSAIRVICFIAGYAAVGLGLLALLRVHIGNLLVGGAVTGVVIGIAAQQTLGNFFAGVVLLFARPYVPGQNVKVRSGALGGPFEGTILGAGLMYTTIDTAEGVISMPNSGLLAAAIGPATTAEDAPEGIVPETAGPPPASGLTPPGI